MEPNWGFCGVVLCLKSFCGVSGNVETEQQLGKND